MANLNGLLLQSRKLINVLNGGVCGCKRFTIPSRFSIRSEEHTSELQSRENLVCRLLLEKKKKKNYITTKKKIIMCVRCVRKSSRPTEVQHQRKTGRYRNSRIIRERMTTRLTSMHHAILE